MALLSFSPAVSAIVTKLIYQRNVRGLGWIWGKTRYQLISLVLPFGIGLVSFGLVWLLGFGGFSSDAFIAEAQSGIAESLGLNITSVVVMYLILILLNGTVGLLLPGIFAFGEELGWRGFLVPELNKHVSFTQTGLISGVIWTAFHFPLLIGLVAPRLGISAWPLLISSMIGGVGLSIIIAWLRLKSGSVWTAVIFHAALNAHNQGFFQNMTTETSSLTHYISGEYGLMFALVSAVVAYFFWRKRDSLPKAQP
jgi:membrane protease YdiL (CAAX protease family)